MPGKITGTSMEGAASRKASRRSKCMSTSCTTYSAKMALETEWSHDLRSGQPCVRRVRVGICRECHNGCPADGRKKMKISRQISRSRAIELDQFTSYTAFATKSLIARGVTRSTHIQSNKRTQNASYTSYHVIWHSVVDLACRQLSTRTP
ncbi:hypothetical protein JB92DRAFT_3060219 [Gautieria morchelliformis]|nr:hypothetical protein JB92DRAFT_3060219 [Gautieria morchelliformis]